MIISVEGSTTWTLDTAYGVWIVYTNHRGDRKRRKIIPLPVALDFGGPQHPYHPNQWMLHAYDLGRQQVRSFALNKIESWEDPKIDYEEKT